MLLQNEHSGAPCLAIHRHQRVLHSDSLTKVSNYGITSRLHLSSSHTHHVASIYGMPLKATEANCCVALAVRTCYHNNLVTGSDVSGRNIYDIDIRRIQCVPFIVSVGMAAVAGCPDACFLRDKAAVLDGEIKPRPSKGCTMKVSKYCDTAVRRFELL
jgi:hypothetical protein